jgi:hypothetical protein
MYATRLSLFPHFFVNLVKVPEKDADAFNMEKVPKEDAVGFCTVIII